VFDILPKRCFFFYRARWAKRYREVATATRESNVLPPAGVGCVGNLFKAGLLEDIIFFES
jgi:hypothetical protein